MKKLIFGIVFLLSNSAFAISDENLIAACLENGKEKIEMHARAFNCKIIGEIEVSALDNRWYNPSKYVWYAATLECPQTTMDVEKMVQYYAGKCL